MKEKRPIKVYIRVRPFNEEEKEREEASALEIFKEESRIKVLDERHSLETSYFFDGVFSAEDNNEKVYLETAKPLVNKLLNGINCALLTYGQTGTGKTHTVLAEGSVTSFTINHLFDRIAQDAAHKYKVVCSFVQVYQDKVYDMLSQDSKDELCLREHPKKGIYVANLSYHAVKSAEDALNYLNEGRKELIIAETRMVRHSSRSHAIFQLCIERRLDPDRAKHNSQSTSQDVQSSSSYSSDMNNSYDFEGEEINQMTLEEDIILRGKIDICDLAGSERLGKTMAEGVRLSEAKHINSSLLELGNVIYALSEGTKRHIPFRNSTLTRLLQVCLGPQCRTSFIVCVAPTASEAYETRCSLNFGTRARKITNKERLILNVEIDYKILSRRLAKRIEYLENQLEKDGSQILPLKRNEIEAPITVETQTSESLPDLPSITIADNSTLEEQKHVYTIPKMEIVIISELMNILFADARGKMDYTCLSLIPKIGTLLHDLLCVVMSRKENLTTDEATWTEIDLEQVLKESLDDLDLMREASGLDDDASFQANDIAKYADYVCNRMEERCRKTEDDMRFCLEKFNDLVLFEKESSIHEKMKKLIEFLENNKNTEIPVLIPEERDEAIDLGFLSWMVNVHMALRITLLVLHISKSGNGPNLDTVGESESMLPANEDLDETFDSISAMDEDTTMQDSEKSFVKFSSFAALGEYATSDLYTIASTPKRGLPTPLCFQNQFCKPNSRKMPFDPDPEPNFDVPNPYGSFKLASYLDSSMWLHKDTLNVSLASIASGVDSIDDTLHDIEVSHAERLRQRRLLDANVAKIKEKCALLEDKNSKLMRTLNVVMKENKDIKEKLNSGNDEKIRAVRESEEAQRKLQRISSENSSLERSLQNSQMERKRWESEALKLNTENHQIRIDTHALKRQIELKSNENESLREEITELRAENSLVKADQEFLSKQLEEKTMQIEVDSGRLEAVMKEKERLLDDLKGICLALEKTNEQGSDDAVLSSRKRSKSCNLTGSDVTFETELFVAIENNIRIEGIVNEVKSKLAAMTSQDSVDNKDNKASKEGVTFVAPKNTGKSQGAKTAAKSRVLNGDTKASALRRSKSLKAANTRKNAGDNADKDAHATNQIKGSKIKELMNEKIKVENSYKELLKKHERVEEELKTAKNQIEMLVNECGSLDHELGKYKKANEIAAKSLERVNVMGEEINGSSLFLRTKDIENLGEKHQELKIICEDYENKVRQLELELESSHQDYSDVKRHARDVEHKYDDLQYELQHYKNQSHNQKLECSRLKEHLVQLGQELNREQQRCGQLNAKLAAAKEKYALQVSKMETELVKCVKKLDRYRERERERRQEMKRKESSGKESSVNEADSGLMPDQSEDYLDLT